MTRRGGIGRLREGLLLGGYLGTMSFATGRVASCLWHHAPVAGALQDATLALAIVGVVSIRLRRAWPVRGGRLHARGMAARGAVPPSPGEAAHSPRGHLEAAGVDACDRSAVERHVVATLGSPMASLGEPATWPGHLRALAAHVLADPSTPDGAALRAAVGRRAGSGRLGRARTDALVDAALGRERAALDGLGSRHAFAATAFMALLADARARHPTPTQGFAWLRAVDPDLWHALNDMGRPSCHVPAIGPAVHHEAELAAGRALPEPRVAGAVDLLVPRPVPSASLRRAVDA